VVEAQTQKTSTSRNNTATVSYKDRMPVRALAILIYVAQMNLKLSGNFDKMLLISLPLCNSLCHLEMCVVSVYLLGKNIVRGLLEFSTWLEKVLDFCDCCPCNIDE